MNKVSSAKKPFLFMDLTILTNIILVIVFVLLGFAYWWPIRFFPYYGDTATLVVNGTKSLVGRSFQPLILTEFQINHPPLFFLFTGVMWNIFGESLRVTHALMIPWLVLLAWSFYKLANKYFSTEISLMCTFLLLFVPFVVNQFQLVSLHLAVAALTVTAIYLWLIDQKQWSMIVTASSILISWTGILILPAMATDWYFSKKKVSLQIFLIPLATIVLWLLYHNVTTGWFFLAPNHEIALPENLITVVGYTLFVFRTLVFTNIQWLYFLPGMIVSGLLLIFSPQLNHLEKRLYMLSWVTFFSALLYFSFKGNFSLDTSLFLFPILLLVTALSIKYVIQEVLILENTWMMFGILAIIAAISISRWRTNPNQGPGFHASLDHSLSYQDNVILHRQAVAYLQLNFPNAQIIGAFPEVSMLTEPHLGYLQTPLNFQLCSNYETNNQLTQILYLHPYHQSQIACYQLHDQVQVIPLEEFRLNSKGIELYKINSASESSTVDNQS